MQLVYEKENSEFKPVKLRLKIDLVSYPARAEGLVNVIDNKKKIRKKKLFAQLHGFTNFYPITPCWLELQNMLTAPLQRGKNPQPTTRPPASYG